MTERIYRPDLKHPEPYQDDLNPDAAKGINWGDVGEDFEQGDLRTAKDVDVVHQLLQDYNDADLDRIPLMPIGARLETNATYINLNDDPVREFTAEGKEEVGANDYIVAKKMVDYELWNRLIGRGRPPK
jgi:hypothetical protein